MQNIEPISPENFRSKDEVLSVFHSYIDNRLGNCMRSIKADDFNCMKFAHYMDIYSDLFAKFLNQRVNLLEIGVQHGGSLQLWKSFFGDKLLTWTGIDIDTRCEKINDLNLSEWSQVYIGSQDDLEFLSKVCQERGPFDIIIDDGSHRSQHIIKSFKFLSAYMSKQGIYVVEDLHATYWGGFRDKDDKINAIDYFASLIHILNSEASHAARAAPDLKEYEKQKNHIQLKKIEFISSIIACHFGNPYRLIEWKAGAKSILSA